MQVEGGFLLIGVTSPQSHAPMREGDLLRAGVTQRNHPEVSGILNPSNLGAVSQVNQWIVPSFDDVFFVSQLALQNFANDICKMCSLKSLVLLLKPPVLLVESSFFQVQSQFVRVKYVLFIFFAAVVEEKHQSAASPQSQTGAVLSPRQHWAFDKFLWGKTLGFESRFLTTL